MADSTPPLKCTHYVFPFSLYSIMSRFTAVLGATTGPPTKNIAIENRLINLHRDENIDEWYLLTINPKGQVPAMTVEGLPAPLADSRDISYWLCEVYPKLLPEHHRSKIQDFLSRLHAIEGISLTVARPEEPEKDLIDPACGRILARTDITPEYRRAVEFKDSVDQSHWPKALHHVTIDREEERARVFLGDVAEEYRLHRDKSPWLFGGEVGPTVLDAHLVPFVTRLVDSGRERLAPEDLLQYARRITTLPQWLEVTHGRRTKWDISYGHSHLLEEW